MKKKLTAALLALILGASLISPAAAAGASITIDGSPVAFTQDSGSPFIDENDRTLVPLRVTMESYGCEVLWDNENRCGVVYKDGVTVVCPIGEKRIIVNGESVAIDTAAVIESSRTYLPIRAVLEAMGASVDWDVASRTGIITRGETDPLLHQEAYISRAAQAISSNSSLSAEDAEYVLTATTLFLQSIAVDETRISKMCTRLSRMTLQYATPPDGGGGYCQTYDNVNFTVTINPKVISEDIGMTPIEVLFHELCHMFAEMPNTNLWFREGMTALLTLSIAGNESWDLYGYDGYIRIMIILAELFGTKDLVDAYLVGDQGSIVRQLQSWTGRSDCAAVLNSCAEQMTSALAEGLFFWMGSYNASKHDSAKASYESAASQLTELLASAWQAKYGEDIFKNPLMEAYTDLLNCYIFASDARSLYIDPAFSSGSKYNYYGRADYRSYFVLKDKSHNYCDDGELIVYRYAA